MVRYLTAAMSLMLLVTGCNEGISLLGREAASCASGDQTAVGYRAEHPLGGPALTSADQPCWRLCGTTQTSPVVYDFRPVQPWRQHYTPVYQIPANRGARSQPPATVIHRLPSAAASPVTSTSLARVARSVASVALEPIAAQAIATARNEAAPAPPGDIAQDSVATRERASEVVDLNQELATSPATETTPIVEDEERTEISQQAKPPTIDRIGDAMLPAGLQRTWLYEIREAYALADRGALFAARREFVRTLYNIAQEKDLRVPAGDNTNQLARGLRALEEAADLLPDGSRATGPVDLATIVDSHQTRLAVASQDGVPATALIDQYHDYAQQQLAGAVFGTRAGSMALHALGKIYAQIALLDDERHRDAGDKAITLQRAALAAHGANHLAANELGYLLARRGELERARQALVRSLELQPSEEARHNLALVDRQLASQQSAAVSTAARKDLARPPQPHVQWVSPEQFARRQPSRVGCAAPTDERSAGAVPPARPAPPAPGSAPPTSPYRYPHPSANRRASNPRVNPAEPPTSAAWSTIRRVSDLAPNAWRLVR